MLWYIPHSDWRIVKGPVPNNSDLLYSLFNIVFETRLFDAVAAHMFRVRALLFPWRGLLSYKLFIYF